MRPTLVLCPEADTGIRQHGREAYPHECCGTLIGREQLVMEALALPWAWVDTKSRCIRFEDTKSGPPSARENPMPALHRKPSP